MTDRRRVLLRTLGVLVSGLLLAAVGAALGQRWDEVRAAGGLPGWAPVLAAVAAHVAGNLVLVEAWRRTAVVGGASIARGSAVWLWSTSTLARYAVAMGQLGGRAVATRASGHGAAIGAVTAVIEVGYLVATTAALALLTLPAWLDAAGVPGWVAATAVVPTMALIALTLWPGSVLAILRRAAGSRVVPEPIRERLEPIHRAVVGRDVTVPLLGLYVVNLGTRIAAFLVLTAAAAAGPVPVAPAVGAFASGTLIGLLVVFAPAGLGVREGTTVLVLAPAIGTGPALVVAAAMRLCEIVAELATLALGRWTRGRAA